MPLATIRPLAESGLYHIHFLDGTEHPSQGLPGHGGGVDPGYGVGGRPPHVSNRPPGSWPGHPDQGLPGHGGGGIPDHELPSTPPPQLLPGYTLVMVRGPDMKWKYAAIAPGTPPPRPLPEPIPPGGQPDQGLPPQPPTAGQLPGQPGQPPVAGQPLPPTPQPR
jgi:hypothetical protein